jgi:hypothetical protein
MCLVLIPQDLVGLWLVAYIVCGFLNDILTFFHLVLSNICCSGGYSLIFDPHNKNTCCRPFSICTIFFRGPQRNISAKFPF